ncbi:MAG: hypothetical protein GEU83_12005 [Pseudonocardiaceae bacterium]|nr:hypothetical protein [Pseudonocardiaceae bacterium]
MSVRRVPPRPDTAPGNRAHLRRACWSGREPAEALPPRDRDELIGDLWSAGWTDTEIAAHTYMSTYTTARIRQRLGLTPRKEPPA